MEEDMLDEIEGKMFVKDSEMIKELFEHISEFNIDIETIESMPAFKEHINFLRDY